MYIARVYGIEFVGETVDDVIDRVIEYEEENEVHWTNQPEFTPEWVD